MKALPTGAKELDYRHVESVCFVFLHGIGDFVMFTPALKKIKAINPRIRTTVVLRKELGLGTLAESQDYIDCVLEMPLQRQPRFYVPWIFWTTDYWTIKKRLRKMLEDRKFDRVQIIYNQLLPTFMYLVLCPRRARAHRIDRLAREAGVILDDRELNSPVLHVPDDEARRAGRALKSLIPAPASAGTLLVGIQRNTMDRTRFIPFSAVQDFINGLNADTGGSKLKIFFLVFANEASCALEQRTDGGHLEAANLLYSFRMEGGSDAPGHDALGLSALVQNCDFILSVDSAVFNIACALGKPVIGVFNNYKVRGGQRALKRENILWIDSPRVSGPDLLRNFHILLEKHGKEAPQ